MILRSMPGIGRINLATLLCEGSGPLSRRDYPALRTLCGAAPVTKRSGKSQSSCATRRTSGCATWCIIGPASPRSTTPKAASAMPRCWRGKSHGRALRGVADRLLGLACVLLQRQTPFDPNFAQAK